MKALALGVIPYIQLGLLVVEVQTSQFKNILLCAKQSQSLR